MRRGKLISCLTAMVGIMMISIGLVLQQDGQSFAQGTKTNIKDFNIRNIATSADAIVREAETEKNETENLLLTEVVMETAPASVIIPPRVEVYEGMTLEEIAVQLEKTLKIGRASCRERV